MDEKNTKPEANIYLNYEWAEQMSAMVPIPSFIIDSTGKVVSLNNHAKEALELTKEDQGARIIEILKFAESKSKSPLVEAIKNNQESVFEGAVHQFKDGREESFAVATKLIYSEGKGAIGAVVFLTAKGTNTLESQCRLKWIEKHKDNLKLMAEGRMDVNTELDISCIDKDLVAAYTEMDRDLLMVKDSIKALANDAGILSAAAVAGKLATRADVSKHKGVFRTIVSGVNDTLDAVVGPLNVSAKYVDDISKGAIPAKITDNYNGDFNVIKTNLNQCIDVVNNLVADAGMLRKAAVEGKLSTRADASKHQGDYRKIVQGVNDTLDAVIGPLNVSAKYVDDISKGAIPAKITDTYNGDFNVIKTNLNQCIDVVNNLVADAGMLSKAAVEGKLSTRADASKHQGDYRKIVQGVNDTLDAVIGPLNVSAKYVDDISKGAIPAKITDNYNGDFNVIKTNLNMCIDAVNNLVADAGMLSKAAVEGKLATRADATKHHGDYRKIVQGVNDTLDAVIGPLNVSAKYVDDISKGAIPAKITDNYNGDFNVIKTNLNQCIDVVNNLVADAGMLRKAAVEGKLSTRADASKHQGDYRKIVAGSQRHSGRRHWTTECLREICR